jgi:ligand-binding SRPBCC domain-containing protein
MKHFSHRFVVRAPLARVAEFHYDARALRRLTPPPAYVQFHRLEPLAEGSVADFTLWLGLLPVHWVARHGVVDPQKGFTDVQERGPFAYWLHRHSFEALGAHTTAVLDELEAQPGRHPLWGLVSWFLWLSLPVLFAYRAWQTRRMLARPEAERS